jgi:hypothetical protein
MMNVWSRAIIIVIIVEMKCLVATNYVVVTWKLEARDDRVSFSLK